MQGHVYKERAPPAKVPERPQPVSVSQLKDQLSDNMTIEYVSFLISHLPEEFNDENRSVKLSFAQYRSYCVNSGVIIVQNRGYSDTIFIWDSLLLIHFTYYPSSQFHFSTP